MYHWNLITVNNSKQGMTHMQTGAQEAIHHPQAKPFWQSILGKLFWIVQEMSGYKCDADHQQLLRSRS